MNLVLSLYTALLFVVLTPGILLTLPKGGSKLTVAAVHGLVFAVVLYFTAKFVVDLTTTGAEGFGAPPRGAPKPPPVNMDKEIKRFFGMR